MVKALFDTNILIDFLNGVPEARRELALYSEKAISVITWMEVLVGAPETLEVPTRAFLEAFTIVPLKDDVAERAVTLRREQRMKLPDAVIWASAEVHSMLLVTRSTKDFPPNVPGVRMPYFR
jgi:predicted nucleic acid-binding protein